MSQRPTIVRGGYISNRSLLGNRSVKAAHGLIRYVTYGNVAERANENWQARGTWQDQAGRTHPYADVRQWAKAKVHRFKYGHAYQLLLSTGEGGLHSADFNTALQAGSNISQVREWRMMIHTDTRNQHAHVILFRHQQLA